MSSGRVVDEFPPGWVQVWFRLSGGPANALGMGAEVLSPDRVRLPCAPWAALNAAKGDVFQVQRGTDGQLWIQEKLEASGYCAIRLALAPDSPLGPIERRVDNILDKFTSPAPACSGWP